MSRTALPQDSTTSPQDSATQHRIAVIGPFPPPTHGQALLGELIAAQFEELGCEVRRWHVVGATDTDDIGAGRAGKAVKLAARLPRDLWAMRRFRPTHVVSTIGIADSMAVAIRDCVVPWLVKKATGARTFGYLAGMAAPELVADPSTRSRLSRLLRLFDGLLEPYEGTTEPLDPELVADVIPFCSDPPAEVKQAAASVKPSADAGPLRLVHVANLYEAKGAARLIEAIGIARRGGTDVRAVIAGGDTIEQTADDLRAAAEAAGVADLVEVYGSVPAEQRWELMLDADVMVLATDYRAEMLPLTLIDATATGLGILSTTWRGIGPTFRDCPAAILVDEPEPTLLAEAITQFADRDRDELRRQALRFYDDRLSVDRFRANLGQLVTGRDR